MRAAHITSAIVLRSWPFGESDKIVSFLTEYYGKIVGIAKGAKRSRKRFMNTLEPFSLVNLRFQDRSHSSLAFVVACDLLTCFQGLATSLEKIAFASYLVEITDGLIGEREENRPVFAHLRDALVYLDQGGTSLSFLTFFELRLLKLVGYQPSLECCRRCGKNRRVGGFHAFWRFSPQDGGILCGGCSKFRKEAMPIAAATLDALSDFQEEKEFLSRDLSLSAQALSEIRPVLLRFIQYQMNREIKSAAFLCEVSSS